MVAEMIILFLRSPTLNMKVGRPFRGAMTALLEKMSVSARRLACAVFMNTQPSITALMISPTIFWMINTVMARGHSSVTILPPKPMVTCSRWDVHNRQMATAGRVNQTGRDSHLDFDREEEGRGEGVDGGDAGDRARLAVGVAGLQVAVSEGQQPPDHSKQHPGAEEGRGEDEEGVLPLQVHHGGKNILQEPTLKPTGTKECETGQRAREGAQQDQTSGCFLPVW